MTEESHPGLGSGALREPLETISAKVHEQWMENKRKAGVSSRKSESGEELMVPYGQLSEAAKELDRGSVRAVLNAQAALSLSSPIEPGPEPVISCRDCGATTLMWAKTTEGYEVIHSCKDGKQVREMFAEAQASSEIRERPNLLSSIPLATGRDSITNGWTVDPTFLLEVRELLSGDECPDLEAIEAVVLALNQLQTKRALALSRQGAGGK